MIAAIKAEFRKLLATRSTYGILLFALVLEGIFAFWANGVKAEPRLLQSPSFLQNQVIEGISALGLIGAFAAVLLITHEYRYNTIMYSLTGSNRRYKILLAKVIVVTIYALVFTAVMALLTTLFVRVGVAIQGAKMVTQQFVFGDFLWHILFYGWSFAMAGLAIGFLVRNQIIALGALLLIPGVVDQLIGLVLKENQTYLPFNALDAVLHPGVGPHSLNAGSGAVVFGIYLVVAWLAAAVLFQRRDAN